MEETPSPDAAIHAESRLPRGAGPLVPPRPPFVPARGAAPGGGRGRGGKMGGATTHTGERRAAGRVALCLLLSGLAAAEAWAREPGEVSFAPGPDLSVPGAPGRPLADPPRPAPREHFRVIWFDPNTLLPGMGGGVARELRAVFETIGVN